VFCRIVDRANEPASYVAENDAAVAFLDLHPVNEGHTLVVPRGHAHRLADLDEGSGLAMWRLAVQVGSAIGSSGLRCEGINLLLADGEAAGQEVSHVHLHVLPRWQGDGFGHRFPPDYPTAPPREKLDATAARLRAGFPGHPRRQFT
jgi:diadenosine tetraphosphate (Ap4A) HIT family hydrolase